MLEKYRNQIRYWLVAGFVAAAAVAGCGLNRELAFTGKTMGTSYHVKVVASRFHRTESLQSRIDKRLNEINRSMSTYLPDSEISRFNALTQVGAKFSISEDFYQVMAVAVRIHGLSDQTWDPTVWPLVELWGFGRLESKRNIPTASQIENRCQRVGLEHIILFEDKTLVKRTTHVELDLASIAKGYGVDQIAALLRNFGYTDFLVEIGGEVYASGFRSDRKPWRIGINRPRKDAQPNEIYKIVSLHNAGFATSGDYRNFFEHNGRRYSHVIDPQTGYPVSNGVVSVSVIAKSCTFADGLATALMVLGPEKGLNVVAALDGVECLIIVCEDDGSLLEYGSTGFKTLRSQSQ